MGTLKAAAGENVVRTFSPVKRFYHFTTSQVQRITDILLLLYLGNVGLINQLTELFLFQKHR